MPKTKSALDQVCAALSKARRKLQDEAEHLAHQIAHLDTFLGSSRARPRKGTGKASRAPKRGGKRGISAAGRARISAAQKKRWAAIKAGKKGK